MNTLITFTGFETGIFWSRILHATTGSLRHLNKTTYFKRYFSNTRVTNISETRYKLINS